MLMTRAERFREPTTIKPFARNCSPLARLVLHGNTLRLFCFRRLDISRDNFTDKNASIVKCKRSQVASTKPAPF